MTPMPAADAHPRVSLMNARRPVAAQLDTMRCLWNELPPRPSAALRPPARGDRVAGSEDVEWVRAWERALADALLGQRDGSALAEALCGDIAIDSTATSLRTPDSPRSPGALSAL